MKAGQKVGRRELCPCGSGVKYKSCCFASDRDTAEKSVLVKKTKKPRAPRKPKVVVETPEPATKEDLAGKTVLVAATHEEAISTLEELNDPNVAIIAPGE